MKPTMFDGPDRLPLVVAASLAVVLGAAGCGGDPPSQTASTPTNTLSTAATTPTARPPTPARTSITPAPATSAGPGRCHTTDLTARTRELDSAMGSRYLALVLTNRSTSPCRVYGYGGVQLLDAAGHPLPTNQVRDPLAPPHRVLLAPNASAYSRLHVECRGRLR